MPFRMYNSLMGLAKDSLQGGSEGKSSKNIVELLDKGAETEKVVVTLVTKLKELVDDLPPENFATLKYIVHHLRRIVEVEQDNKMTSGNLGIVFGPTLMRPRPTQATISLSSLVDYPHQARIVEALIIFYPTLFESDSRPLDKVGEATQEDGNPSEDQEDTHLGTDDRVPYLGAAEEQGEAALQEDLYSGSQTRFIDSDSEPEDGPAREAEQPDATLQGSETSGDEENPLTDEGSEEGTLSRSGSIGQTDAENVPAPQCCPAQAEDSREEGEKSAISGEEGDGDGKADGSPLDYDPEGSQNRRDGTDP